MSIFKRKPKIIKGHSLNDYLKHYGHGYVNHKNEVITDKNNLKPNCRYYEIDGKYYQIDYSRWFRNALITVASLSLASTVYLPIHFLVIAPKERYHDYSFKYWNTCESLSKLKTFVKETVTPSNKNYVPKVDRIATFDMDGTLFGERSPIYLEWMLFNDYFDELKEKDPNDPRIIDKVKVPNEYKRKDPSEKIEPLVDVEPNDVYREIVGFKEDRKDEPVVEEGTNLVSLEMGEAYLGAQLFSSISLDTYTQMVDKYLEQDAECFNNLKYKDMFYKPMIEVVQFLQQNNFDVYVVSGTDRFMVRTIIQKHLNIESNKVIGMDVSLYCDEDGSVMRGPELKYKNVKEVKEELIAQEIGKSSILSFGNSSGDIQMHEVALKNKKYHSLAFMNVADDREREFGYTEDELKERTKNWGRFQKFSMKNDWKTIYGNNVTIKKK